MQSAHSCLPFLPVMLYSNHRLGKAGEEEFVESNFLSTECSLAVVTGHFLWSQKISCHCLYPTPTFLVVWVEVCKVSIRGNWMRFFLQLKMCDLDNSVVFLPPKKSSRAELLFPKGWARLWSEASISSPPNQLNSNKDVSNGSSGFLCAVSFSTFPYGEQTLCASIEN